MSSKKASKKSKKPEVPTAKDDVLALILQQAQNYNLQDPTVIGDGELWGVLDNAKSAASSGHLAILEEIVKSCNVGDSVGEALCEALKCWCLGKNTGVDNNTLEEEIGKCCELAGTQKETQNEGS